MQDKKYTLKLQPEVPRAIMDGMFVVCRSEEDLTEVRQFMERRQRTSQTETSFLIGSRSTLMRNERFNPGESDPVSGFTGEVFMDFGLVEDEVGVVFSQMSYSYAYAPKHKKIAEMNRSSKAAERSI